MRGAQNSRTARSRPTLYICYASILEPLVHTQVLPYLREIVGEDGTAHLITYQPRGVDAREAAEAGEALGREGIVWHGLRYHSAPSLPATLFDILVGVSVCLCLCVRHRMRVVHARSHVAATIGLALKSLLGTQLLFDVRGLLADEYVDAGRWKPSALTYRLVKRMERVLLRRADAIVMLTNTIKQRLLASPPLASRDPAIVEVIPCCVDVVRFDHARRASSRRKLGWEGRRVLVYVGKLGTWYLPREMATFAASLLSRDPDWLMVVRTQSDPEIFRDALREAGVPGDRYQIGSASPRDVPDILVAADVGLSFIQPSYSKQASSPTKIGEYLAAGLPIIVNSGVGDLDSLVEDSAVGVVTRAFSKCEYTRACDVLERILSDPTHRDRSRRTAEEHLGLRTVGGPAYRRVYERLGRSNRCV